MSHPVWVRGLKQFAIYMFCPSFGVAPRVGAWIETVDRESKLTPSIVAPRVGAWIETH